MCMTGHTVYFSSLLISKICQIHCDSRFYSHRVTMQIKQNILPYAVEVIKEMTLCTIQKASILLHFWSGRGNISLPFKVFLQFKLRTMNKMLDICCIFKHTHTHTHPFYCPNYPLWSIVLYNRHTMNIILKNDNLGYSSLWHSDLMPFPPALIKWEIMCQ